MNKLIYFVSLTILCVVLLSNAASAKQPFFKIGVEAQKYYPQFDNENGIEYFGFARDLLDMFAKEKHYHFVYIIRPVKRLFHDFVKRDVDFKYPDNPFWQSDMKKEQKVCYSDSVVKYIDGVVVLAENKAIALSSFKTLGTIRGFTPYPYLDLIAQKKVLLSENSNYISLLRQVLAGRITGAYSNISVARYNLKEHLKKTGAIVFNPNLPHIKDSYYLSSILYPMIISEFNTFLKDNKEQIDQLKKKYKVGLFDE